MKIIVNEKTNTIILTGADEKTRARFCFFAGAYLARQREFGLWAPFLDNPQPSIRFCATGSGATQHVSDMARSIAMSIDVPIETERKDKFLVMIPPQDEDSRAGAYLVLDSIEALANRLPILYAKYQQPITVLKKDKNGGCVDISKHITICGNSVNIVMPHDEHDGPGKADPTGKGPVQVHARKKGAK